MRTLPKWPKAIEDNGEDSSLLERQGLLSFAAQSRENKDLGIVALLTTVTADCDRVSMNGVRRELLEKQAESIGLPLEAVSIKKDRTHEEWEEKIQTVLVRYNDTRTTG